MDKLMEAAKYVPGWSARDDVVLPQIRVNIGFRSMRKHARHALQSLQSCFNRRVVQDARDAFQRDCIGAPTNVRLVMTISRNVTTPQRRSANAGEVTVGKCYASMSRGNDATAPKSVLIALELFSG
jgi:hypothetical protein